MVNEAAPSAAPQAEAHVAPLGDRALVIRVGDRIGDAAFERVRAVLERLDGAHPAITELVAGFATVTVHYDPSAVTREPDEPPYLALTRLLEQRLVNLEAAPPLGSRVIEIAVCYSGDLAPDLDDVASQAGLSADETIALHTGATYTVHMIGFAPGFPYLAGLDPRIATPRRAEPRTRVAAGSVGIGGEQTGIYPMATPGGWNLIGRTPLMLFEATRDPAALLRVGDRVRFIRISRAQFDAADLR